jgi:transcriptional regulator with XRE-family HTH domain
MNAIKLGRQISRWRRAAGLTQEQLALRLGTKQSVISRVEAGRSVPSIPFIERCAKATGQKELTLRFGDEGQRPTREERRRRVANVLKGYVFDPWDRDPTPAEARTLIADGLTRERFQRSKASAAGRLDDLYLERLRQATINEATEGVEFHSALAVAAARFEDIDWRYVTKQLNVIHQREGERVGGGMKRINSRIRRRVLRAIREG